MDLLKRSKTLLVLAFLCLLSGAIGYGVAPKPEPQRDLLFVQDGVKVYRFRDEGRPVYFTVPASDVLIKRTESCGSECSRHYTDRVAAWR